ncbi:unnamed protein product [Auanema sp. JU1783]|nr:unnamed protein product [Auanema sp. JU1783]
MFISKIRKESANDDDDLRGEDEAEGSQFRQFQFDGNRADFRTFSGSYIGYTNAENYNPAMNQQQQAQPQQPQPAPPQQPLNQAHCAIVPFYTSRIDFPQQVNSFMNQNEQDQEIFPSKIEGIETRMIRKIDMPLFFLNDSAFCNPSTVDPREVYCTVPGRTSLLSSTTKYRVTVGEIQRRISPPECLNASLLGGILRKAKSKDGGKTLRDSLKKIGLTLPAGRRKQANVTALTALVEEEAVHMAKDFALVCEKEFHAREIGVFLTKANLAVEHDAVKRRTILEHSKKVITELCDLIAADRTPLTPFIQVPRGTPLLDPAIQQHISHFTLVTHGFGAVAMVGVLQSIRNVIDESLKYMDRNCPPQMYMNYNSR